MIRHILHTMLALAAIGLLALVLFHYLMQLL